MNIESQSHFFTLPDNLSSVEISSRIETLDNCGGEYSGYQYTIASPNYPNNYNNNEDCFYILRGNSHAKCNQTFHLTFLNFTIRYSNECLDDFLEIGDRSVFCGNVVGIRTYPSKNNTLKLHFHSDNNKSDKGFKILVTTLPCPNINKITSEINKNNWHADNHNYRRETFPQLSKPIINKNSENISSKNIYPIYHPNNKNNTNIIKSINNTKLLLNHQYHLPINDAKLFRNKTTESKTSTYFFVSPDSEKNDNNYIEITTTELSITLSPPIYHHKQFNDNNLNESKIINKNLFQRQNITDSISRNSEKLLLPSRPNNIPPGVPYAPLPGFETQIKTGEVLDNNDCNGKPNIVPISQVSSNTRDGLILGNNYLPSVFEPKPNIFPATIYGTPEIHYPPTIESTPNIPVDPDIIIDSKFIYPNINNQINPNKFIPTRNIGNVFPNINPNYNPTTRQCCNNNYAAQRFLLTSPRFSSLFYSSNSYECIYTIIPSSINICRIRFNLKYFNHGYNDKYCTNGYIEIDGHRYCGCKTGLTIVSNVNNLNPKIIGVNYSGYPPTKFNGFLIEVIQELCPNNNYPNLLRNKKAIDDTIIKSSSKIIQVLSTNRTRRELGYSYPKPNVPFNSDGQIFNSGRIIPVDNSAQLRCETFNLMDWTLAAKEIHFRNARCFTNDNNGLLNFIPPGNIPPGFHNYLPANSELGIIFHGATLSKSPNYQGSRNSLPSLGNCRLISVAEGIISSPGYPNHYPNNVNLCYRFLKTPNGCKLNMAILDFDLENSVGCTKDFLLFSNQNSRYCGRSLTGTKTILEFPRNNIIDVRFATDSFGIGRGFNIGFVQIPCSI
ncbi:hypothetical protein PV327_007596 [Microctonus hyperodae]|uniref:CUB domain-containing protein n=1 Tax=Microctonus hyperodae TaxID=165561 RepID=A0AA39KYM2_MICHY|nr:hypothetical protein PV327_007596 [Microctonus hyperodae]